MSKPLQLEMPVKPEGISPVGGGRTRRLLLLAAAGLLAVLLACLGWLYAGRVDSVHAILDGMVHVVAPKMPGRVQAVLVKDGERVVAGQVIARMDMDDYLRRLKESGKEVAALRPSAMPGMAEMAGRLEEAQRAEREMVERLARLRHDEAALRHLHEERVTAHVQSQLRLRTLDAQGVSGKKRQEAVAAEAGTRLASQQARNDFERASRERAAVERELNRIRDEVQRARDLASQNRFQQGAAGSLALPQVSDGNLYAPVSGQVLAGQARAGQQVAAGDPVVLIAPEGTDSEGLLWISAYFPAEVAGVIKAGQPCAAAFADNGQRLTGTVQELGKAETLPAGIAVSAADNAPQEARGTLFVPVRIQLEGHLPQGVKPGSAMRCTIGTRSLFGFSGLL